MNTPSLSNIIALLLLFLFHTDAIAAPGKSGFTVVAIRQHRASTSPQCLEYSRTANLSTIGANSTYRTAFLQSSKVGTLANGRMLNAAIAKLSTLTQDRTLNRQCGNLTTIALVEAERNFTKGIVAQFTGIVGNPGAVKAGPEVIFVVGLVVCIFGAGWTLMP